jgi:hypothetical protein
VDVELVGGVSLCVAAGSHERTQHKGARRPDSSQASPTQPAHLRHHEVDCNLDAGARPRDRVAPRRRCGRREGDRPRAPRAAVALGFGHEAPLRDAGVEAGGRGGRTGAGLGCVGARVGAWGRARRAGICGLGGRRRRGPRPARRAARRGGGPVGARPAVAPLGAHLTRRGPGVPAAAAWRWGRPRGGPAGRPWGRAPSPASFAGPLAGGAGHVPLKGGLGAQGFVIECAGRRWAAALGARGPTPCHPGDDDASSHNPPAGPPRNPRHPPWCSGQAPRAPGNRLRNRCFTYRPGGSARAAGGGARRTQGRPPLRGGRLQITAGRERRSEAPARAQRAVAGRARAEQGGDSRAAGERTRCAARQGRGSARGGGSGGERRASGAGRGAFHAGRGGPRRNGTGFSVYRQTKGRQPASPRLPSQAIGGVPLRGAARQRRRQPPVARAVTCLWRVSRQSPGMRAS